MIEIPSHFTELFLQDYSFIRQFALVPMKQTGKYGQVQDDNPNLTQMLPIERSIFNKMLFCDKIFEFIELEESLYFTGLDVELHSFGKEDAELTREKLLETNFKHLSAMSINLKPADKE